jgi:serine-type D-Ala-D-Ala endopeptidase (penicillin-binding protein 7)
MKKKSLPMMLVLCASLGLTPIASPAASTTKQQTTAKAASSKKVAKKATASKQVASKTAKSSSQSSRKQVASKSAKKPVRHVSTDRDALPAEFSDGRLALGSSSALVLDFDSGRPVYEKNSNAVVPIASISKLMTAMVILDAHQDMNEVISIDDADVDYLKSTRSRLRVGVTMTRDTAMLLALMSSENRAAHALARNYPGGLSAFMVAMNRKARQLGMSSTSFEEPTGLSSNNVSTAHDLALMVKAAYNYPKIRECSTTAEAQVDLGGRVIQFNNTNALVKNSQWEIGLSKTGYISEAGRCLVMQAKVADKPVVIVLLDSAGKMTRVGDANRIKRWMERADASTSMRRS